MSDTVIKVENLSKSYIIRHQTGAPQGHPYTVLRDGLANGVKHMGNRRFRPIHGHPRHATEWLVKTQFDHCCTYLIKGRPALCRPQNPPYAFVRKNLTVFSLIICDL